MKILVRLSLAILLALTLVFPAQAGWKMDALKGAAAYGIARAAPAVAKRWGPDLVKRYGPRFGAAALETAADLCGQSPKCSSFVAASGVVALVSVIDEVGVHDFIGCLRQDGCDIFRSTSSEGEKSPPTADERPDVKPVATPGPRAPPVSVDDKALQHILHGDGPRKGGGHLHGVGKKGKTEFPASWDADKVIEEIIDVAGDSSVEWKPANSKGRVMGSGTRDGVDIEVIYDVEEDRIVSGYPTNLPRNP